MFVPSKYFFDADEAPTLKPFAPGLRFFEGHVSPEIAIFQRSVVPKPRSSASAMCSMVRGSKPRIREHTASKATWLLPMITSPEIERNGRQHASFARGDGVDRDELGLDVLAEIGDLLVQSMIVVDEAVPIVLNADVVLHREGDRRPRVSS